MHEQAPVIESVRLCVTLKMRRECWSVDPHMGHVEQCCYSLEDLGAAAAVIC